MLQEDSNGEVSFEIVDKKNDESVNSGDKTDATLSGVSSPYSLPSPPSGGAVTQGGNIFSNIPPPSSIPDFAIWKGQGTPSGSVQPPSTLPFNVGQPAQVETPKIAPVNVQPQPQLQAYPPTQFSAAIPPSKGVSISGPTQQNNEENNQNSGLIGWMKDAVASGGILSKVAEKAKSSVDSLITTLDPQMSEFIYSGGDVEISVASGEPEEIGPIREAIFAIFGKAWVNEVNAKVEDRKHQAVGFDEGIQRAELKIQSALQVQKKTTIALENILLQQNNNWYDLSVLVLKDPERKINLQTFTQTTHIPIELFTANAEIAMPTYAKGCESKEKLLSAYLRILNNDWQQNTCGVSRRDTIYLATKSLATIYKNKLALEK